MIVESFQIPVLVFWGFFVVVIFYEILMYLRGKSSESWRQHPARVVKLGIKVREGDDGSDESQPFIQYEYTINKTLYKGRKVVYGDIWTSNYGDSCDEIQFLKVGSEITVYINPKNFNMSVMKQGYRGNFYWFMGMLLVAIVLAVIFQ